MKNKRLHILSLVLMILLGGTAIKAQKSSRPNIIFIMTDDQSSIVPNDEDAGFNFSDGNGKGVQSRPFGFNGDKEVHTPIIDNLAKNGMIFTNAYVSTAVCSPSRYSMLTGKYAGRCEGPAFMRLHPLGSMTRVENNTELEEDGQNLAKLLQKAGYLTGFVGKSHIIGHDVLRKNNWEKNGLKNYEQGDDPKDPKVSEAMAHNHEFWVKRIKKYGFDYANGVFAANLKELYNDSLNVHNIEWKNKAALDFIDKADDEPFFLYYSESVPHGPAPWIKKKGKYVYGLDSNSKFTSIGYHDKEFENMPARQEILDEVVAAGKDPDHAWLTWFDHAVGAVVKKLEEKGILDNTLIVVTSDHGNYNYGKSTNYQSGVQVPLMMYWPEGIEAESNYNELVQNIDFTPTFLELAGVNLESVEKMDGVSLKEVLRGNTKPVHDHLFFEIGFARGVMTKEWKYITVRYDEKSEKMIEKGHVWTGWNEHTFMQPYYIRNSHLGYHSVLLNKNYFHRNQLYNLKKDPLEKSNVVESNPKQAEKMKNLLINKLESFPNRPYGELVK